MTTMLRRRPLVALAATAILAFVAVGAVPATAAPPPQAFATFSALGVGDLDGTPFVLSGCGLAPVGSSDLSGPDFVPAGTASEPTVSCAGPWSLTLELDAPVTDLSIYLVNAPFAVCEDGVYTFGGEGVVSTTIASGLTSSTLSGSTLTIPFESVNSGVVRLTGTITSVTITSDARAGALGSLTFGTPHVEPPTTTTTPATTATPVPDPDVAATGTAAGEVAPAFAC